MTQRELFLASLLGNPTDRVPVCFLGGGWVGRFSGAPAERLFEDPQTLAAAHLKAYDALGQDALVCYFDPLFVPEAYGARLRPLPTGPVVDPIPAEGISQLKSVDIGDGRIPVILNAVEELARRSAGEVAVGTLCEGPFTTLGRIVDPEILLRTTIKDPPRVAALTEEIAGLLMRFGAALEAAGADFLVIADPLASTTMISPRMYRELVAPFVTTLIRRLAIPVILHMCGDTSAVLPLVSETGVEAINLDQCMDLVAARAQLAGTCSIAGNVDPVQSLLMGDPEAVSKDSRRCMRDGGSEGFLLMPGCGVPPGTPLENLKAMIDAARGVG